MKFAILQRFFLPLVFLFAGTLVYGQNAFPEHPKGDSEAEAIKYEKAKKEWIKNNPEAYEKMMGTPKATDVGISKGNTGIPTKPYPVAADLPLPKDNSPEAQADYAKRKEAWIKENKETYEEMTKTQDVPVQDNSPTENMAKESGETPLETPKPEATQPQEIQIVEAAPKELFKIPSHAKKWKVTDIQIADDNKDIPAKAVEGAKNLFKKISTITYYVWDNRIYKKDGNTKQPNMAEQVASIGEDAVGLRILDNDGAPAFDGILEFVSENEARLNIMRMMDGTQVSGYIRFSIE